MIHGQCNDPSNPELLRCGQRSRPIASPWLFLDLTSACSGEERFAKKAKWASLFILHFGSTIHPCPRALARISGVNEGTHALG